MIKPDWELTFSKTFVDVPDCWTTCDSACCKQDFNQLPFAFFPKGASMIFTQREFEWLEQSGKLQEGFKKYSSKYSWTLDNGQDFSYYTSVCKLEGVCSLPNFRPLLCKFFPWFPKVDIKNGSVVGLEKGTLFELFWPHLGAKSPCTIFNENDPTLKAKAISAYEDLAKTPYFLFHFKLVEIVMKAIDISISSAFKSKDPNDSIIQDWEKSYLQGSNIDWKKCRSEISAIYDEIKLLHPDAVLI
ncbi:MAG: hypothetical protein KC493_14975 [Bacteriovoracaceae bacterium]|nr:hypothetical protein [Bacteriovoracaceae bacterium]